VARMSMSAQVLGPRCCLYVTGQEDTRRRASQGRSRCVLYIESGCQTHNAFSAEGRVLPLPVRCTQLKGAQMWPCAEASLAEVLKLRRLPAMEGRKFNLTPVDWVAKADRFSPCTASACLC
jgi:hypothetical protein